jgi:hypothetical protein
MFGKIAVYSVLATVFSLGAQTAAQAGSFTRGCAARDIQILRMIDESDAAETISATTLNETLITVMQARMVCHEGRVLEALALYESVSQNMTRSSLLFERSQ